MAHAPACAAQPPTSLWISSQGGFNPMWTYELWVCPHLHSALTHTYTHIELPPAHTGT